MSVGTSDGGFDPGSSSSNAVINGRQGACVIFRQPPGEALLHDGEEVPYLNHTFNFNDEITTRSPTRSPPHTALCPCSHTQAMRRAHLLDGAVPG